MWGILLFILLLLIPAAQAQVSASATPVFNPRFGGGEQTFSQSLESEELAPVSPTVKVEPSVSATLPGGAVSGTAAGSPFEVRGVVVTLSQTTGFARDAAMDMAARKALPQVLAALPMEPAQAAAKAKAVGNPLTFVSSYRIAKEVLIPTYALTVDLTFNEAMLRSNFGGVRVAAQAAVPAGGGLVSTTVAASPSAPVSLNHFVVRVATTDPTQQDKVYRLLSGLTQSQAHYRVMAGVGAEFTLDTPYDERKLDGVLGGTGAVVMPVEAPAAVSVSASDRAAEADSSAGAGERPAGEP